MGFRGTLLGRCFAHHHASVTESGGWAGDEPTGIYCCCDDADVVGYLGMGSLDKEKK